MIMKNLEQIFSSFPTAGLIERFAVYDTEEDCYWRTPKYKVIWRTASAAKRAVCNNPPWWMKKLINRNYIRGSPKFDVQDRLIIVKREFVQVETTIVQT
jgi:hypothetical protein